MRLIVGESVSGTTRCALEIADRAAARGYRVVWGHAWDDAESPAYWIWTQILRELDAGSGTDLATLVMPEGEPTSQLELFDATARLLQTHAAACPLLLVLDDLHLADQPSIALLEFIAAHLRRSPIFIVATCQDETAELLAKLERFAVKIVAHSDDLDVALASGVETCRAAARAATASHSHAAAVSYLQRALQLTQDNESERVLRAKITLELAGAVTRASGRAEAEPLHVAAWELAVQVGDPDLLGRVAARHSVQYYFAGNPTAGLAAQCRIALQLLSDEPSALRARLHGVLAAAVIVDDPTEARLHAQRAVTMARTVGEPIALAIALIAEQVADLGPSTLRRRLETAREIVALASDARAHDLAVHGRFLLMGALLERGDVREFDVEIARQDELIDRFSAPRFDRHALWFRCTRAMLDGDADLVETLARECFEIAERLEDPDGVTVLGAQYGVAVWMRGRIIEMEGAYLDQMRADPYEPIWPATLAWMWASHGRLDEARGALGRLPAIDEIPQGQYTLLTLVTAADAALATGDDALVAELWEALLPYHDHFVPIAMGAAVWGTVAQRLGELALRLGRRQESITHLEAAISMCAHVGARPWLTDAQLTLARVLLERDGGNSRRAARLIAEAAGTTRALGLTVFDERVAQLTELIGGDDDSEPRDAPIGYRAEPVPRVVLLGTFAVTGADGSRPVWTSRKARTLLKLLVANRGTPVPRDVIMDILWPREDPELLSNRLSVALSTVRTALDPTRAHPSHQFLAAENDAVRLVLENVVVDTEVFLETAKSAISAHRSTAADARSLVRTARELYAGPVLPDEPYAGWAAPLRREVEATLLTLLRAEAELSLVADDDLGASDAFRLILEIDPYDEGSHHGLITSLRSLGAFGQAEAATRRHTAAMAEIGVPR